ncbi:hypothetical protein HMPREF9103_02059 [Lentilactobacillus parafarraginis F0439]|uniref:Uncharacterized protein n=1 Tax=Lentilactobacillus parafarraginis F0439 TaxID=797515 RepID=G9ZQQ1_9LACO|nr:hypothetical protein HMPREF9103_02059 [Lentilactobacillus parafarraginis F0439]
MSHGRLTTRHAALFVLEGAVAQELIREWWGGCSIYLEPIARRGRFKNGLLIVGRAS